MAKTARQRECSVAVVQVGRGLWQRVCLDHGTRGLLMPWREAKKRPNACEPAAKEAQ